MAHTLGAELPLFLAALSDPAEGLRVNPLRVAPEVFRRMSPFPLTPLGFPPEGFTPAVASRAGRHPYHAAGLYYLQDPGAMAVGAMIDPEPGERVLDLAAAPGGKATHLAARMRDTGLLVANDVNRTRALELAGNLERLGVTCAMVTSETPARLADRFGAYFDRVLLDAPCSGESMFHKSAAALADWSEASVAGCARRQDELVGEAARLVRPGGLLVYSTCTFSREENEGVVERFLAGHAEFEPVPLAAVPGEEVVWSRMPREGAPAGTGTATAADAPGPGDARGVADRMGAPGIGDAEGSLRRLGVRLWPHRVAGAGHFVAAFRRVDGPPAHPHAARETASREARAAYMRFLRSAYPELEREPGTLSVRGDELFELPTGAPATDGLRLVRAGLWAGGLRRSRFEPAHALALALPPTASPARADHPLGDDAVERYLAGHPIESAGEGGWIPVCVDGFALGWGKRVGTTVKNHLPKGLRWRG